MASMDEQRLSALAGWVTDDGLTGRPEAEILAGFCERMRAAGLPLATGLVVIDTLHPVHEGHAIRWTRDQEQATLSGYGRTSANGKEAENWRRSTFYRMLEQGETVLRRRLTPQTDAEFSYLATVRQQGLTDYLALVTHFGRDGGGSAGIIGDMDCLYSSWLTDRAEGFAEEHIAALRALVPFLALAMKTVTLGRIAETLVETYLGRDAGRLVLGGRIGRGTADRIDAVLWFSDLRGYTRITDTCPPEQIVPLLNDYADAAISAIHEQNGDVLKLMGDGVLAIFRAGDRAQACRAAITAALAAGRRIDALNAGRAASGLPTTQMYLGLHVGAVFFGNIGSDSRLDFTVVGPAVNEVSRISALCRSVDQTLLVSAAFAAALGPTGPRLVSVGRYALRGVRSAQELFTLDPEQPGADTPEAQAR